jgi:hypothetical protein
MLKWDESIRMDFLPSYDMAISEETPTMNSHTVESLLGRPLNDIETHYPPNPLYVKGQCRYQCQDQEYQ